jgi:hypothetical protein
MVRRYAVFALALLLSVFAVALGLAVQKSPLALKPGLWKMTAEYQASAAFRDRLPPSAMAALDKPSDPQLQCLTQEDIAANRFEARPPKGNCRVTINSSSATEVQLTQVCTVDPTTISVKIKVEAPTPTTLKVTWTPSDPGVAPTMVQSGTWLAASCTGGH